MSVLACALSAILAASSGAVSRSPEPAVAPSAIVGIWEVTGAGGEHNVVTPDRLVVVFEPDGVSRLYVWSDGDVTPQVRVARYAVHDAVLEIAQPGDDEPGRARVRWDGSTLVLEPLEPGRPRLPLRLERRAWM